MTNNRPSLVSARIHRVNRIHAPSHQFWLRRPIEFGFRSIGDAHIADCTELGIAATGSSRDTALRAAFAEFERIWQAAETSPAIRRLRALVGRVDAAGSEAAAT